MTAVARRARRADPLRVVGVTLGLSAAGALFGATAGALGIGIVSILSGVIPDVITLFVAGVVGAALGTILTPIAGWLLLRRVPLGRLFVGALAGAVLGGVLGWFAAPSRFIPVNEAVYGAIAGFFLVAVAMWRGVRPRQERPRVM